MNLNLLQERYRLLGNIVEFISIEKVGEKEVPAVGKVQAGGDP